MDNRLIIYGFIALFVLVTIYYLVECYSPFSKKVKAVDDINKIIGEYDKTTIVTKFEEFNEMMLDNSLVKNAWQSYEKTLIKANNREGLTEVFSIASADDFFNSKSLSAEINLGFFQNFASVFTGLGILGTFAGLTIGLYGLDLSSTDVEELKKGIGTLLGGMNTAFVTSLIGLACALFFNYAHSKMVKRFEDAVTGLAGNIDGLFPIRTAEEWLSKNYEEAQQQTVTLKNFDTELAMKVGNALDNSLEKSLKPVMEQLLVTINKLNTSGIEAVGESIAASAGKEMKDFVQSLTSMQRSMETLVKDSRSTNDEINRSMLEAVNKMKDALNESGKNINVNFAEAMNKMNTTLKGLLDSSKSVNEEINRSMLDAVNAMKSSLVTSGNNINANLTEASAKMTDSLSKHEQQMLNEFERIERVMKNVEELVQTAGKTAEQFKDAAEPVRAAVESVNGQLERITDTNSQFIKKAETTAQFMRDAADKNQVASENIGNSINGMEKSWRAYENNFNGVSDGLENTLQILLNNLKAYNNATDNALKEKLDLFDKKITGVLTAIGQKDDDIEDNIDELQRSVKELKAILKSRR